MRNRVHHYKIFLLLSSVFLFISVSVSTRAFQQLEQEPIMTEKATAQPHDIDNYPVAPKELELQQVHIYVRHGERTPVGVRLTGQPANLPQYWSFCKTARRLQASVSGLAQGEDTDESADDFLRARKIVEREDGHSVDGDCLLGELTDVGRMSTYNYGKSLRHLYIEKLGFLPDTLHKSDEVYFRTTNIPRTTESLQQIIHGLYPTSKCHVDAVPPLFVRNAKDENLFGNASSCKRLEILLIGFAQAAATAYNHTLEPLDKKLSKYIGGNPIRVDGKPRASGILDTVRAAVAHNIKVPPEFEEKGVIDVIERAVVTEWFAGYKTEEVRRLGMGRLLQDLSEKMDHKVEHGEKDPLKILVHSTHDTALAGLTSTLDVFDEKWPPFTASVTFELFKKTAGSGQSGFLQTLLRLSTSPFRSSGPEYFVRMRYKNKDMHLPICADEGRHLEGKPEFCRLEVFRERVKELTPKDWEKECEPAGIAGAGGK